VATEILATKQYWPGLGYTDAAVAQLTAHWNLVREVAQHPVWQKGRAAWEEDARRARMCLLSHRGVDLDTARMRVRGPDIAHQVVQDIRAVCEDAQRVRAGEVQFIRVQAFDPIRNQEDAQRAVEDGRAVADMVGLPGWEIVCARLIARAMAHLDLMRDCPKEDMDRHLQAYRDGLAPIADVQRRLDRAVAAADFLLACAAP